MNIGKYTNHLGNVLLVSTDRKMGQDPGTDGTYDYYHAVITAYNDYGPFGNVLDGRSYSGEAYRYGFNGQEGQDELYGAGNATTAEYWMYDSRLGRRWNVDPIVKPWESSYAAFSNNPIYFSDVLGLDGDPAGIGKSLANVAAAAKEGNDSGILGQLFGEPEMKGYILDEVTVTGEMMTEQEGLLNSGTSPSVDKTAVAQKPIVRKDEVHPQGPPTGFWWLLDRLDNPGKYAAPDRTGQGSGDVTNFGGSEYFSDSDNPDGRAFGGIITRAKNSSVGHDETGLTMPGGSRPKSGDSKIKNVTSGVKSGQDAYKNATGNKKNEPGNDVSEGTYLGIHAKNQIRRTNEELIKQKAKDNMGRPGSNYTKVPVYNSSCGCNDWYWQRNDSVDVNFPLESRKIKEK